MEASQSAAPVVKTKVKILLAGALAFIYGWSDGTCYMRYKVLPTLMTGNIMLMCYSGVQKMMRLTHANNILADEADLPSPTLYLQVIACWMLGVVIYQAVSVWVSRRTATLFAPVVALVIVMVEVLHAAGESTSPTLVVCLLAPVFAVGTAVSTRGPLAVAPHAFTGHLQSFSLELTTLCLGNSSRLQAFKRLAFSAMMIISFTLGAMTSVAVAYMLRIGGVHSDNDTANKWMLMPAGLLMSLLLVLLDCLYTPRCSQALPEDYDFSRQLSSMEYQEHTEVAKERSMDFDLGDLVNSPQLSQDLEAAKPMDLD